jgi:hypothetical protein
MTDSIEIERERPELAAARHVTDRIIQYLKGNIERLNCVNVWGATPETLAYYRGEGEELMAWLKAAQDRRERQL